MTIDLTDDLTIIPPDRAGRGRLIMTILGEMEHASARLQLSKATLAAIGMPSHVALALSRHHIAVLPAAPDDPRARRVSAARQVCLGRVAVLLGLRRGDRFRCPLTVREGSLVADWPTALFVRRQHRERSVVTPIDGRAAS